MTARLMIVGGAPATGKTTLSRALGAALGLPVITKDDVKEALAEPFPTGDRDWSRRLGVAAYEVLYTVARRIVEGDGGLVLESNFTRARSEAPLRALADGVATALIVCRVADPIRRARFEARAAVGRHRVHIDSAITAEWNVDDGEFLIDIGVPRLIVDTADGHVPDLGRIIAFARER